MGSKLNKLPVVNVQISHNGLLDLNAGLLWVDENLNKREDNDYEELLKLHCVELISQVAKHLECEEQKNYTIKLGSSAAFAFVRTWERLDTSKQPLLTTVIGKFFEAVDKARLNG